MAAGAERMKIMRARRRSQGVREIRLVLPDARSSVVREELAREIARLSPESELAALRWIDEVSVFNEEG